jgi:phosphate starvation-inducible protein PhoH and related proteins
MFDLAQLTVDSKDINLLYKQGWLTNKQASKLSSYFFCLKSEDEKQSALAFYNDDKDELVLLKTKDLQFQGFKPKDGAQSCMFWALKNLDLVVAMGSAGTGKTTVSLAYALHELYRNQRDIILCKPTTFVGQKSNAIAAIPGDHREKLEGYMDSYMTAMKKIIGQTFEHHLFQFEEEGRILFKPFELLRGQHFENSVVIIDEAQNTTPHELLTAISRVGQNCTLIILGDPYQVDTGMNKDDTGLWELVHSNAFINCSFAVGIELTAQYRGPMAQLAQEVIEELRDQDK